MLKQESPHLCQLRACVCVCARMWVHIPHQTYVYLHKYTCVDHDTCTYAMHACARVWLCVCVSDFKLFSFEFFFLFSHFFGALSYGNYSTADNSGLAHHNTSHRIASHCQYGMSDHSSGISIEIGGKRETKHSLYDEKRSFGPFLFPPKHDGRLGSSLFRISSNSISHMAAATDILGCRTFQPIQLYHIIFRNLSSNWSNYPNSTIWTNFNKLFQNFSLNIQDH